MKASIIVVLLYMYPMFEMRDLLYFVYNNCRHMVRNKWMWRIKGAINTCAYWMNKQSCFVCKTSLENKQEWRQYSLQNTCTTKDHDTCTCRFILISFRSFFEIWVAKIGVQLICDCGLSTGVYNKFLSRPKTVFIPNLNAI